MAIEPSACSAYLLAETPTRTGAEDFTADGSLGIVQPHRRPIGQLAQHRLGRQALRMCRERGQ
jgi:hypothetical protein